MKKNHTLNRRLSMTSLLLVVFSCLFLSRIGLSQEQESKLLTKVPGFDNTPITISNMKLNDQALSFDKSFTANEQWLKSIDFEIRNTSDKNIAALEIVLLVTLQDRPRPIGLSMRYGIVDIVSRNIAVRGVMPGLSDRGSVGKNDTPSIPPKGMVALRLAEEEFDRLRSLIPSVSIINSAAVYISKVAFDDGTMWTGGRIFVKDGKSNAWIPEQKISNNQPSLRVNPLSICICGEPKNVSNDVCCINWGCATYYGSHATIDCHGEPVSKCSLYDAFECICFPGTQCTQCAYAPCESIN